MKVTEETILEFFRKEDFFIQEILEEVKKDDVKQATKSQIAMFTKERVLLEKEIKEQEDSKELELFFANEFMKILPARLKVQEEYENWLKKENKFSNINNYLPTDSYMECDASLLDIRRERIFVLDELILNSKPLDIELSSSNAAVTSVLDGKTPISEESEEIDFISKVLTGKKQKKAEKKQFWTEEEDRFLKELKEEYPEYTNRELATKINNKFHEHFKESQIQERWARVSNPRLEKGRFTIEEDSELKSLFEQYNGEMTDIAKVFSQRSLFEIRRRAKILGLLK